ncbi:MAG: hypothetical protein VR64_23720 [Desulfatitalea sp. BRH_c12]|nr:MAG: hypothetical protein VR64_23720 [Desulfatitalea sp. BRH_c12]
MLVGSAHPTTLIRSSMAMLIASVIGRIQRFIAMSAPVSTQSLGQEQGRKPMMLFMGNSLR